MNKKWQLDDGGFTKRMEGSGIKKLKTASLQFGYPY